MKISKILFLLTVSMQLASCQTKMESGFVIQESKLYYDSKEIVLGMPVEQFTEAMGMYDRINIDSSVALRTEDGIGKKKNIELILIVMKKNISFF